MLKIIAENLGLALSVILSLVVLVYAIQEIETFMHFSYPAFIPSTIMQFVVSILGPIFIVYMLESERDSATLAASHEFVKSLLHWDLSFNGFITLLKYLLAIFVLLYNWGIYLAISWFDVLIEKNELLANFVSVYSFAVVALVSAVAVSFVLPFLLVVGIFIGLSVAIKNYLKSFSLKTR